MPLVIRPARAQELERAEELVVASINELTERHGFGPMANLRPPHFQLFSLQDDPDGLWVAEDAGEILGFTFSWVCGDLWFLAELFVSPGHQGRGIGNALLRRTLEHAQKKGATNKALITFAFNTVSQGLYIRHGLFPRLPIYFFNVSRESLGNHVRGISFRCVPLENTAAHLQSLAEIDARALGTFHAGKERRHVRGTVLCGQVQRGPECIATSGRMRDRQWSDMAVRTDVCVADAIIFCVKEDAPHRVVVDQIPVMLLA
ncbi:MAG: GNAT family N-acetyltransferase [Burkholderiaceae bacterium]